MSEDPSWQYEPTSESAKPDGYLVTRYEGSKAVEVLYGGTATADELAQLHAAIALQCLRHGRAPAPTLFLSAGTVPLDEHDQVRPVWFAAPPAQTADVRDALLLAQRMCREALPKFNWGASCLDANAIRLLNEAPSAIDAAIAAIQRKG